MSDEMNQSIAELENSSIQKHAEAAVAMRELMAKSGLSALEQSQLLYSLSLEKSLASLGSGVVMVKCK